MRRLLWPLLLLPSIAFGQSAASNLSHLAHGLLSGGIVPCANGGTGSSAIPSNGYLLIGNGTCFTLATITAGANITITNSAGGITIASTASGSGTVSDGSGTTTANEVAVSTSTAHNIGYATTLPTSALPALAGDVTSSAGSNSVTVSKVSGSAGTPTTITTYNATSGTITVSPPTGALGTINLTWPDASGTLLYSGGPLGTPASGNGSNITNVNAASVGGYTLPCTVPTLVSGDYLTNNGTTCSWSAVSGSGTVTDGAGTTTASQFLLSTTTAHTYSVATPAQAIGALNSAAANAQTGTTYTFVIGDANGEVTMSNAAANTVTIPPNSSVAFPIGTLLTVEEVAGGVTSLSPGSGVTITSAVYGSSTSQSYSLGGVYGFIQIQQTATNTWNVVGWTTPVKVSGGSYSLSGTCTTSAHNGNAVAGTVTMSSAGGCTLILTFTGVPAPANGFVGTLGDRNQSGPSAYFYPIREASSTTSSITWDVPGSVSSGDVLSFGPVAGY